MPSPEPDPQSVSRRTFLTRGAAAASMMAYSGTGSLHDVSGEDEQPTALPDCVRPDRVWQYKRLVKEQISRLHDGLVDEAITCLHELSTLHPTDPEFMYGLCIGYTLKGDIPRALEYVQQAVDNGLPFTRFQAGPRSMLRSLHEDSEFIDLAQKYGSALIHGPMLGCVTDSEASFWVRTWDSAEVQVEITFADAENTDVIRSSISRTDHASDFTTVVQVASLEPSRIYRYQVLIDSEPTGGLAQFSTFPEKGKPAQFEIGFGGCSGYTPWHERIWRTIADYGFPLFLLTGDNVYIDDPTRDTVNQYCYYRRQSRPEFRALVAGASIAAIWDDHDFGTNDSWGGPEINEPDWKVPVWDIFRSNWNNPSYGGGAEQPGCWFKLSIADVDLFMLDDRYYRTNHREPPPDGSATMLGPAQKAWLYESLARSTATFKLLVTSVPWAYGVKPGSTDPWQGYKEERDELFSFLSRESINGVVLLSGDRHRADIWKIEREGAYPLYDFENARLTNLHTHDVLPGAVFGYNEKCTFGRLRFDTTLDDPEVIYDIITIDDEIVYSFPLKLSTISH